jgi:hypothetical protein
MNPEESVEESRVRRIFKFFRRGFAVFSAWLLIYISIGSMVGLLITCFLVPRYGEHACLPYMAMFFAIESKCPNGLVNLFWSITVGFPEFTIIFPAMAAGFLKATIVHRSFEWLPEAIFWLIISSPMFAVIYSGTRCWWKRDKKVALASAGIIAVEIVVLGYLA